jgi:hypothetical protein
MGTDYRRWENIKMGLVLHENTIQWCEMGCPHSGGCEE